MQTSSPSDIRHEDAPEGGLLASTNKASTAAGGASPVDMPKVFVPANAFRGARDGYVFKTGLPGLGYYRDSSRRTPLKRSLHNEAADVISAGDGSGSAQARKRRREPVDVTAAAQKLGPLLLKPKKTAKAASLLADLMQAEMRPDNAQLFFRCDPCHAVVLACHCGRIAGAFHLLCNPFWAWWSTCTGVLAPPYVCKLPGLLQPAVVTAVAARFATCTVAVALLPAITPRSSLYNLMGERWEHSNCVAPTEAAAVAPNRRVLVQHGRATHASHVPITGP